MLSIKRSSRKRVCSERDAYQSQKEQSIPGRGKGFAGACCCCVKGDGVFGFFAAVLMYNETRKEKRERREK